MQALPHPSTLRLTRQSLPGSCEVCLAWTSGRLCPACHQRFAAPCNRCVQCALALPQGQTRCGTCLSEPPPFERCLCVADYAFPWDRLITRFKYQQSPELAPLLARCLLQAAMHDQAMLPQAFVPVPLSDRRLAERGYDQAWQLARCLARESGLPTHARALERRFDGRQQALLTRAERLANLRGAFAVPAPMGDFVRGRHLDLVDDVLTTRATAHEAATALRAAGAARVDLWVVARTPAPQGQA